MPREALLQKGTLNIMLGHMPNYTTSHMPSYTEKNLVTNGLRLTYFESGAEHRGARPTLLFVHATGFHARIWDKIAREFPDHHLIAVDQRGHGRSEKRPFVHWDEAISDMSGFIAKLRLRNILGIGHSMGGHVVIGAASRDNARFRSLVAIDPVVPAEPEYEEETPLDDASVEMHPTAKRRRHFASPEEMADRLRPKGSFSLFDPDIFMDYCRYGLLRNETGDGYVLACPPEIEASVYMSARSNRGIYAAARSLDIPVTVARAREPSHHRDQMNFANSPTWPGLASVFKHGKDVHFHDKSHFLPMQVPDEIVRLVREQLAAELPPHTW